VKHERHVAEADYPSEAQGHVLRPRTGHRSDRDRCAGAGTAGAGTVILSPGLCNQARPGQLPVRRGSFSPIDVILQDRREGLGRRYLLGQQELAPATA